MKYVTIFPWFEYFQNDPSGRYFHVERSVELAPGVDFRDPWTAGLFNQLQPKIDKAEKQE